MSSRRQERRGVRAWPLSEFGLVTAPTRALTNLWSSDSGLVLTGSVVDSWTDSVGGAVFLPTTAGVTEWRYVAADSRFRGQPLVANNFAGNNGRMIAGAGTDWTFLHDGTGSTLVWIGIPGSSIALNTNGGGATAAGVNLRPTGSGSLRWRTNNGSATVFDCLVSGIANRSNPSLLLASHKTTAAPDASVYRGTSLLGTANEGAAVSTGAAAQGLEFYAVTTAEISAVELRVYNDVLTADERQQLALYAWQRYGVIVA